MLGRRSHSAEYKAHIASPEWRAIRKAALERACYRCQFCGLSRDRLRLIGRHLEVHHNNYRNLGKEQPEDLVVLCAGGRGACHAVADKQRRANSRARRDRKRRRGRGRRRRSLGVLRLPVGFLLAAAGLKLAAIVLPAVS
jgi:5-methylcytosine-specific restriction endonuclease McrA